MADNRQLVEYKKPYLSVDEQVELLLEKGLAITDREKAKSCLERIGYYRLSGYWYPFYESTLETDQAGCERVVVGNRFRPGSSLETAVDLYVFDKRLRLLMLDAIERVEVGVRVGVALTIGKRGPWVHRDEEQLQHGFRGRLHQEWLDKLDKNAREGNDDFLVHHREKYSDPLPIWVAIEAWDFGMLLRLFRGLRYADQQMVSKRFGVPRPALLESWLRAIGLVRNICAHHARLWNRALAFGPSAPKPSELPELRHFSNAPGAPNRLYSVAAILQFLLRRVHDSSTWSTRLAEHLATLPVSPDLKVSHAGFPDDWRQQGLWM